MARIQKPGLDYFPLDTDFVRHPIVRRLKKQEGDRALSVLIETLSWLYRNEGYYVRADRDFCEELATDMFDCSADDVQRILNAAAEKGLFHLGMLQQHGILTSADIQRQYLLCVRRRTIIHLNPDFCLLPPEEIPAKIAEEANGSTGINATFTPQNVASGTQSNVKKRQPKQSIENPPLQSPPDGGGAKGTPDGEDGKGCADKGRRTWTQTDIDALRPPADGKKRNFDGLRDNLRLFRIPPDEQYAIIRRSDYGAIGHSVWRGFCTLRDSGGKIKLPGKYLLSLK